MVKKLLIISSILLLWGLFTLGTASFPLSQQNFNSPWNYLIHQLSLIAIGLVFFLFFFKIKKEKLKQIAPYLFLFNLFLLILVFLPKIGMESKGASRWLDLGFFSLQPSEFLKITFILYLAAWLSGRTKKNKNWKETLLPFIIMLLVLVLILIFQPDMTTLAIIFIIGVLMYFFAPTPLWHTLAVIGGAVVTFGLFILTKPYRLQRLTTFLNPEADPLGKGYQVKQAAISLGSGKTFGIGLGFSRQKFGFLPEAITDSIFAIVGEELGFLGCLILLSLFLSFCFLGLKLALKNKETFSGFVALGITVWICLQALLNIAGIVGIMPLGGIPLPFFSYGGSHIIAELIGLGILLNIAKNT